jgi:uncharacterized membrane protein YhhN
VDRLFAAAVIAGASYSVAAWNGWDDAGDIAWKAYGVGLLAAWAAVQRRWWLTAILAFGALGDVLIEVAGLAPGGAAFAAGHVAAILFYMANRRPRPSGSQRLLGWLIAPVTLLIAWSLTHDRGVALYAALLGAMAGCAWLSRCSRYRVGLGATLFVASDLLLFAEFGPLAGSPVPRLLVWPLYFAGQAMIAWGVNASYRATSSGRNPADLTARRR